MEHVRDGTDGTPDGWWARGRRTARPLVPGLLVAMLGGVGAQLIAGQVPLLTGIVVAIGLGILLRNARLLPATADDGLAFAATRLLRVGIVLLGFRLALGDLLAVGGSLVGVVVLTVLATLGFTYLVGRLLGLPSSMALLTGTGYAICGATAVAAMREVLEVDDDAPALAIALVTVFGTLSIVVLPAMAGLVGLGPLAFGQWAGTAVHDVGQVVATAASGGEEALAFAVAVKLTRVLLLGPLLLVVGLLWRRRTGSGQVTGARPVLLPRFIVAFAAAVALRTTGLLPDAALEFLRTGETWFLTVALLGLGTGVRIERLLRVGGRAIGLGIVSFLFVAGLSLLGVLLVHGARSSVGA